MTEQETPDLTDYESLPIYEVAKCLAAVSKKPLTSWLRKMVDSGNLPLDFREDRLKFQAERCLQNIINDPSPLESHYSYKTIKLPVFTRRKSVQLIIEEPSQDNIVTLADQIKSVFVNCHHFRAWCLSAGYPLPRFWYGSEALPADPAAVATPATTTPELPPSIKPEENHGKQLAEQRHADKRPSAAAIKEIVGIIRNKAERGEPWHQLTEIDAWLQRNPTSKASRNQFKNMVKESLHNVGITPANGRPLKK